MYQQLNVSLGVLKHIAADLDQILHGSNHTTLRMARVILPTNERSDTVQVYTDEGFVKEYDVKELSMSIPAMDTSRMIREETDPFATEYHNEY